MSSMIILMLCLEMTWPAGKGPGEFVHLAPLRTPLNDKIGLIYTMGF